MKKSILILALSALMIPAFVACNKDDATTDTTSFEAPEYQLSAQKLTFESGEYKSIEFTESGRYIAEKYVTKADDDDTIIVTGTYTMDGQTYVLDGTIRVEVSGSGSSVEVKLTDNSGNSVTVGATTEKPESKNDIYRTWKIDNVRIKVTGGDLSDAGVSYTTKKGCDLAEIADYLKKNGVNFDATGYEGYNVQEITVSGCGGFIVVFEDAEDFIGEIDCTNSKFDYDLSVGAGNNLINAKGTGTIEFTNGVCVFTLKGTISGNSQSYNLSIEFRLVEA